MSRARNCQMILALMVLSLVLFPASAFAGLFGPRDYNDCIIEGMKGVQSDMAARMVHQSCREKFSTEKETTKKSIEMPPEAIAKLSVRGGSGLSNFSGQIYNGNSDWTVTEFTIKLTDYPSSWDSSGRIDSSGMIDPFDILMKAASLKDKNFRIVLTVPPYSQNDFSLSINWPEGDTYEQGVEEARGYKNPDPR